MLLPILICLSLSLAGITGLLFFYLAYLDRLDKDQKKRIRELEHHCQKLSLELEFAEEKIASQNTNSFDDDLIETEEELVGEEDDNEVWADVLE